MCKWFYRVTITLDDKNDPCSLAFDFQMVEDAASFAKMRLKPVIL